MFTLSDRIMKFKEKFKFFSMILTFNEKNSYRRGYFKEKLGINRRDESEILGK